MPVSQTGYTRIFFFCLCRTRGDFILCPRSKTKQLRSHSRFPNRITILYEDRILPGSQQKALRRNIRNCFLTAGSLVYFSIYDLSRPPGRQPQRCVLVPSALVFDPCVIAVILVSHKPVVIAVKLNFVTRLSIKLFQETDFNGYQIRHYVVVRVSFYLLSGVSHSPSSILTPGIIFVIFQAYIMFWLAL